MLRHEDFELSAQELEHINTVIETQTGALWATARTAIRQGFRRRWQGCRG